jgi:branched-chain amino acid aminotransferase
LFQFTLIELESMPVYIRILTPAGLQPAHYTADSLADAARYEPDNGVYTLTNTFNTFQVLKLDAHLNRLEDSARREAIPLNLDRNVLRAALRQMIADSSFGSVRFRITVSTDAPQNLIISLEPFKPLAPEFYAQGIKCVTASGSARHHPEAKTTDWMHDRVRIEDNLPTGVYTALLLSETGDILEGISSNFYAILDGELRSAGTGVLPGIAQQVVYEVAPQILPVRKDAVNVRDLPQLSEAFITSASRGIVPVVEIDGVQIGEGVPGEKTHSLQRVYNQWVQEHLEDL